MLTDPLDPRRRERVPSRYPSPMAVADLSSGSRPPEGRPGPVLVGWDSVTGVPVQSPRARELRVNRDAVLAGSGTSGSLGGMAFLRPNRFSDSQGSGISWRVRLTLAGRGPDLELIGWLLQLF